MITQFGFNGNFHDFLYEVTTSMDARGGGIFIAFLNLFHRLLGFTQMAGIVSDNNIYHNLSTIFSYPSLANYYTEYYLGYNTIGHSSSPSLLGAAIILGGHSFWFIIIILYVIVMFIMWMVSPKLKYFEIPFKCFLGYESFNTIIAGTLDSSFYRISLVLISIFVFEALFQIFGSKQSY
jgi:hypothetical protein